MLYVVGTPIGNLEDISFRALKTLEAVDLIAAEDTRHTLKLLNHFEIKTPLTSYYEHNKREKGAELLRKLQEGLDIAVVTDAGMPGISDPGADLVALCIKNSIEVTVIPGPTAFSTALVLSGLPTEHFCFEGFLSAKKSERISRLEGLKADRHTLLFYEAPHKLLKTLSDLLEVFGDREIAVCRELTKKFEQVVRGTVSHAIDYFTQHPPKGEFVLVVAGAEEEKVEFTHSICEHVDEMIATGMDKKEAIASVAKQRKIPKKEVYNTYLKG